MKLIDKDAVVAEIRKRLLPVIRDKHYDEWEEGQDSERKAILAFIDTLEVKNVEESKNQEWSAEDERNLNAVLSFIDDEYLRKWLKNVVHERYD